MLKPIGIILGIAGAALWFMPLAKLNIAAMNYAMSVNGKAASALTLMTYGVPTAMLLFSAFAYTSRWQLQLVLSILGAICVAALYKGFGGGYTPAFFALSAVSALCVVTSLGNALAIQRHKA